MEETPEMHMGQLPSLVRAGDHTIPTKELAIRSGRIKGVTYVFEDGRRASAFLSIPYAKPPVGELRFHKPEPIDNWDDVKDCTKLPPRCPHQDMLHERLTVRIPKSEDCLYMNVFTPGTPEDNVGAKLPVMVFVHGGGFVIHSSSHYGDVNICKCLCVKDVLVVTFNYRTGAFGFMCTADERCPGNNGFWDMRMALQWVQDNIASFGGDPNNVTIFGQSAGGAAVDYLSLSPHTNTLFHRYIAMAGNAYAAFSRQNATRLRDEWLYFAKTILGFKPTPDADQDTINDELLTFLRQQPAHKLELSLLPSKKLKINNDGRLHVCPVVDGDFFPEEFAELRKKVPKMQIITGITEYESLLFVVAKQLNQSLNDFVRLILDETLTKYELEPKAELIEKALDTFIDSSKPSKSVEHKREIVKVMGDVMFNNSTRHLAESLVKNGHEVYLYTFSYCRPSIGGMLGHLFPFKGATHSSELAYLFGRCIISTHFHPHADDLIMMDKFTTLFANFARYGNPNGQAAANQKWLPVSVENPQRNYVINLDQCTLSDEFNEGRYEKWLSVWPNIYELNDKLDLRNGKAANGASDKPQIQNGTTKAEVLSQ